MLSAGAPFQQAAMSGGFGAMPVAAPVHYWPVDTLHAFTLQMAARGHCVSASMMLGDACYAREQLRHAQCLGDKALHALASELADFFMATATQVHLFDGGDHARRLA